MKRNDLYFDIKKDITSIEIAIDYLDLVNTQSDHDNRNLQRAISHLKETKKEFREFNRCKQERIFRQFIN